MNSSAAPSSDTQALPVDSQLQQQFQQVSQWLGEQVIGQPKLVERLLIALLADGHLLLEGAPGLAKTRLISCLSQVLEGDFQRIQFTPDLLPADITGSDIFNPQSGQFSFQAGPVFHNLILADEINRAPAKVQSALLEAMAERQVSVGQNSYPLEPVFMVMATQNPLDQEGTYPLPEAQLDRFLMKVLVDYPDREAERAILHLTRDEARHASCAQPEPISKSSLLAAREQIFGLYMAGAVENYLLDLTMASRQPAALDSQLAQWLELGVSPRATIALDRCARARAWLAGRDHVTPDDVQAVLPEVFRHRLLVSFSAQASGVSSEQVIDRLLALVAIG